MSAIATLKYRAEYYCSSPELLKAEFNHLFNVFLENGYSKLLIKRYLYSKKTPNTSTPREEEKYKGTLIVPFIKDLHKPLQNLCKKAEFKLLYRRSKNLGDILCSHRPPKDTLEKKNVVYQVNCEDCNAVYIGQTLRQLGTRMDEQLRDCIKAKDRGIVRDNPKNDTGLPKHALAKNHSFDVQHPKILHEEKATGTRKMIEGMYIHLQPNTCNSSRGTPLDPIWHSLLTYFKDYTPNHAKQQQH